MSGDSPDERAPLRPQVVGRYALFGEIAAGGMATVHYGRLVGPIGFSRMVAIKRLHPQFAKDPEFLAMFLDEARLASRVQHPNVVNTIDVVNTADEVFLVMEYVHGETLSRLLKSVRKREERIPPAHVVAIVSGLLHGLHAAHEARNEKREPLGIVHRDVSPQNLIVGVDGVARVLDFGVAKAELRSQSTREGQMKGKLSYMSPEQLNGRAVDRRTDVFAAGVVLWEALVARRLFEGADAGEIFAKVLAGDIAAPSTLSPDIPPALDQVVLRALDRDVDQRYQTAREFATALEDALAPSSARNLGEWVERCGGKDLARRAEAVAEIEGVSTAEEDLERLADEQGIETLDEELVEERAPERERTSLSGARPKLPPPPPPPPAPAVAQVEERSQSSVSSTSAAGSLALPEPQVAVLPAPAARAGFPVW
ncbi:MAG: serine/threonine protein kinase, partial [Deltaproteobacteria bacterium]|nr:serine/threonine protein kinase [Deltaproteobacteria bacterium]